MDDKISALIEAQAAYQVVEPYLPVLNQGLPVTSEAIRATKDIQSLATDSHVAVTTIDVSSIPLAADTGTEAQEATASDKLANFPISLSVTGAYPDIKSFTTGILNLRRIMQITSMMFSPASSEGIAASGSATTTGTQIKLDLKLKLFYLSE